MADKNYTVSFHFPDMIPAHHAWQVAEADASNLGLAINRAWSIVKTRPAVKGKRLKRGEIKWHINEGGKDDN